MFSVCFVADVNGFLCSCSHPRILNMALKNFDSYETKTKVRTCCGNYVVPCHSVGTTA